MVRVSLLAAGLFISMLSMGCCGPMGCGPGCQPDCYDCDGCYQPSMPCSPMDGMRQFKRRLVCGGGCGEVYMGEWVSTPPDACDPCCDDQWVGGATKCRPFCWQPGSLLAGLRLYGQRCCEPGCGCDTCCDVGFGGDPCCDPCCGCDGGCDGGFVDAGGYQEFDVVDGGMIQGEVISGGSDCGCASCAAKAAPMSRMATQVRPSNMPAGPLMKHRVKHIRR